MLDTTLDRCWLVQVGWATDGSGPGITWTWSRHLVTLQHWRGPGLGSNHPRILLPSEPHQARLPICGQWQVLRSTTCIWLVDLGAPGPRRSTNRAGEICHTTYILDVEWLNFAAYFGLMRREGRLGALLRDLNRGWLRKQAYFCRNILYKLFILYSYFQIFYTALTRQFLCFFLY